MNKVIDAEGIVKSFGEAAEQRNVLDGITVEISEGEFVSVMGPSGSGKSTLMFALSGMDNVNFGKVMFDGRDLSNLKDNDLADIRRTRMGFVFQQPTFLQNLNILDNIILPSIRDNKKNRSEIILKAKKLMKETGISELEDRGIKQVSGGQLQRAGICRALMSNPEIIFGDEPTGALNSKAAEEIMNLFTKINEEGTAIMIVTHDAKIAARSERILFMLDGRIVNELQLSKFDGTGMDKRVEIVTGRMLEWGV